VNLPFRKREADPLDMIIEDLIQRMTTTTDAKEYDDLMKHYVVLSSTKANLGRRPLDINVVLTSITTLASIGLVINHEQVNVVTSWAKGFVKMPTPKV